MWKIQRLFFFIFIIIVSGINFSCDTLNPSDNDNDSSTLIVKITEFHSDVKSIMCRLSSENFESRYLETTVVQGKQPYLIFENVKPGAWQLNTSATNTNDICVYSSMNEVEILEGQVSVKYLNLKDAFLIHTRSYSFEYDFSDADLHDWAGPAFTDASEGMLHLWSEEGYKWRSISGESNLFFQAGTIEFDVRPMEGVYSFETKGTPCQASFSQWGVYLRWQNNRIFVINLKNDEWILIDTGIDYQNFNWYHVTIKFNNNVGENGKFSLSVQDLTNPNNEFSGGQYNYHAVCGLVGVNRISLGVYDTIIPRTEIQHIYYDNFRFELY